jgi:flavin-dependent dehydrogenase
MKVGSQDRLSDYRIVIIGGGPAGSSAAIMCANLGFNVEVIEYERFPRGKPGETLHPGVEVLFRLLGVYEDIQNANFIRPRGICTKWCYSDPPKVTLFGKDGNGQWLGYQALRSDLDDILLSRARDLGAVIIQPCSALDILIDSGKVIGVTTSTGRDLFADFVVDAGGGGHWLARKLNLAIEKHSPRFYVQYGYAKGECLDRDQLPLIQAIPEGWIWTAKVKKGIYQWTRLNFKKPSISPNWLPDEFEHLTPIQAMRGANVTWRRVVPATGSGYFIAGDAATVIDPASSHGVLRALMSGIKVAHAMFRILHDKYPSKTISWEYNNWISQWFLHDVARLRQLYAQHPNPLLW